MDDRKQVMRRIVLLITGATCLLVLFLLRLISIQLVNGASFLAQATNTTEYSFDVTAARGEIVDCYGRRLATNEVHYDVVLNNLMLGKNDLNETLHALCIILEGNGETWEDELLISVPDLAGRYTFTSDGSAKQEAKLTAVKEMLSLQQYASADNIMLSLVERYDLGAYETTWQRTLAAIRYQMERAEFSNHNNFTLSEDVSDVTVAMIKERSLTLQGAEITEVSVRSYADGTIMPHVLGRVSKITAEQWYVKDEEGNTTKPLADKGYAMNDMIGISGLELAFEEKLRGTDGEQTIVKDEAGVLIDSDITEAPMPGLTLMTTVNADVQKAANEALEATIKNISATGTQGLGAEANAGAVVAVEVDTGAVVVSSTYPSYDQNLYLSNYTAYAADPDTPLFNRALMGLYTPGSTYKLSVGLAALLNGVIDQNEIIYCSGVYTYYTDYHPGCVRHGHSGSIGLVDAIKWSCNIYFYDIGRRTGSEVYDQMAYALGLGVKTGVEVPEALGRLTTKEDENYTPSLEIQAAIGQGNTVVSPIQLATYGMTIANNGTRYQTHFVKALLDTNTGETVESFEPVILAEIEDDIGAFAITQEGMIAAASTIGSFANYPYTVACKTGTPQRSETYTTASGVRKYYSNTTMVAYAPAEDPQIAVGVVIEYGASGAKAAELVAKIFDAYFFEQSGSLLATKEGTLLE